MISTSRMTTDRVLVGFFLMPEPDPRTLPVIQPGRGFHVKTCIKKRILLICALRAHNSKPILKKVLLGIEKVLTTFSIPNKTFPKMDLLINRTLKKKGNFIYCYWFFLVGIKAGVIVIELGIKSYMYDVEQKISVIKSDCVSFLDWQSNLEKFEKVLYHLSAW